MHVLTKIMIVLAVVAGIALSAIAVTYTLNADRLLAEYRQAEARADALQGQNAASIAAGQDALASAQTQIALLEGQVREVRTNLNEAEREAATARADQAQAERELRSAQAQGQIATSTIETQATLITELQSQNVSLVEASQDANRRVAQLSDQNFQLEANVQSLNETVRQQQVIIAQLQGDGQRGNGQFGRGAPIPTAVTGRVLSITPSPIGTLVEVNLGTQAGVRQGLRLQVTDNRGYVGDLVVTTAELTSSVARVQNLAAGREIRRNQVVEIP